jgi:hypothetical protein
MGHLASMLVALVSLAGIAFGTLVSEQEPNDLLSQANPIVCGDTVLCAGFPSVGDVDHFRFFVNQHDSLVATTFNCNGRVTTNTYIALYDDRDSILAVNDDGGPQEFSRIRYLAFRSAFYTVRVARHMSSGDSVYSLTVHCPVYVPEAYDLCATPRLITALPYYDEGTTLGMTSQCGRAAPDVFYRFYNPAESNVLVTVCTETFDARVQILGRCCIDFFDDADQGCGMGAELVSYSLLPGDYYIMVEGMAAGQAGNFSLEVNAVMPDCPAPRPVTISTMGTYPFLDWPDFENPSYYVVWCANNPTGPFDHLGTTFYSFFVDSSGFSGSRKYYQVTSICPW